ncbi:uncharacterized protein LOC131435922 [Malaya genurostris]|uniref:uncharacterized protein LOC131435922 n=1 Tax=Malaya genurostris TaxID=325434 RepID=UPI0026F392F4|nr:uncharacterized protein LOC131435922 [Malaya genurostris]
MYSCIGLANNGQPRTNSVQRKFSTLPPNVNGRRRGTLEIRLPTKGIRWKSAKSYSAADIQLIWWGQPKKLPDSESTRLHWEQGKTRSVLQIPYGILTSEELFRKYLQAAEPVYVRLVSSRTSSLIGTALVPIPVKIVNFRTGEFVQIEATSRGEILSKTGFKLGEICFEFNLKFDKLCQNQDKQNKETMVQSFKKELPIIAPKQDLVVQGDSVVMQVANYTHEVKQFRSLDHHSRDKVLNYLLGKAMSGSEDDTLSEICSISPTASLMDALSKFDTAPQCRKGEYLKFVDSVLFCIETLKFTKAGLNEIFQKSKTTSSPYIGFMVKVEIPFQSSSRSTIKFNSTSISDDGETFFNGKATTKINWPQKIDNFQFEFVVYLALGQVVHHRSSKKIVLLGSATVKLDELLNNRFSCYKRCPVRLVADDIALGMLTVRLELGARGLHFGADLVDAVMLGKENISISSTSSECDISEPCWSFKSSAIKCCNKLPNWNNCRGRPICCTLDERKSNELTEKTVQSQGLPPQQQIGSGLRSHSEKTSSMPDSKTMASKDETEELSRSLLHGILHFGHLKDAPALQNGGYFLVIHGFWSNEDSPVLTTEHCQNQNSFNYLITFPVIPHASFLERTKNQHMLVELWQKSSDAAESLVGVTRLPLHQFYIAFRDAQLTEHLARAKLPVISIDGWSGIGSPLASDPCGQVQAVLAIGTENQIEYFKLSRGFKHTSGDAPVIGNMPTVPGKQLLSNAQAGQTSSIPTNSPPPECMITPSTAICQQRSQDDYNPVNTSNTGKQQSEVANMLSAFIENLAQRLPISSERSTAPCYDQNFAETKSVPSYHSQANQPQLRQTSDLLENLQRALTQQTSATTAPDKPADSGPQCFKISDHASRDKLFKVSVEIEQAVNLPKMNVSKKYGKRNKNRNSGTCTTSGGNQRIEVEPSSYVTFEGYNLQPGTANTVKSHEGIVYTTAVVENSSNPSWHKKLEVFLPVDLMINDEKCFILKVWRKAVNNNDLAKCRMLPAPMEDAVVGFSSVDLSVLMNGMPCILGWYNIMDFSGRCNGQIKVNITPMENVSLYKNLNESINFQIPLSIDVECAGLDAGNTSLSRALKRKFTELEEITQRLKARLFDVTGNENDDPDEEFERDLNTEANETDDDGWVNPSEDTIEQKPNRQYPNGALTMTTNTSSYSMSSDKKVAERSLTGCSDHSSQQSAMAAAIDQLEIEKLLKKHDLDTLINPNILKNLLNPAIVSTSESTPMSNPYENIAGSGSPAETSEDADMSEGSAEVGGSIASDRVKLISSALQRTTISDACEPTTRTSSNSNSERCEHQNQREAPEGEPMKINDK